MKNKYLSLFLFSLFSLSSCGNSFPFELKDTVYNVYGTYVSFSLYEGNNENVNDIKEIIKKYDVLSDNYQERELTNVYTINHTNEEVTVSTELYNLLETSFSIMCEAQYFNPLLGSLNEKWKEALKNKEILSETVINEELTKINNSSFSLNEENKVQRLGEALIDLGGIAKGYLLDKVKEYLVSKNISKYLIDAGRSSILLGEKEGGEDFVISISDLNHKRIKLKNSVLSTSGTSEQHVVIDDKTYSHIVNPFTGSALAKYDAIIVISDLAYKGDAFATSLMNNTIEEIKEIENNSNIKVIVAKGGEVLYKNENIVLF